MGGRYTYGFGYDTPLAAYLSGRWQALCISTIIIMSGRAWLWADLLRARCQRWGCDSYTGPLVSETAETLMNLSQPQDTLQIPKFHQLALGVEHSLCKVGWMATAELTWESIGLFLPGLTFGRQSVRFWCLKYPARCERFLLQHRTRTWFFFKGHCLEWDEAISVFSDLLSAVMSREICSLSIIWITINADD